MDVTPDGEVGADVVGTLSLSLSTLVWLFAMLAAAAALAAALLALERIVKRPDAAKEEEEEEEDPRERRRRDFLWKMQRLLERELSLADDDDPEEWKKMDALIGDLGTLVANARKRRR